MKRYEKQARLEEQAALLGNVATTDDSVPAACEEVELVAENVTPQVPTCRPRPSLMKEKKDNLGDHYNGDDRGSYKWSQSIRDVDLILLVPQDIQRAKQVKVKIEPLHLKIEHLAEESWNVLVDQDFSHRVSVDECIWSLVPGEHIQVITFSRKFVIILSAFSIIISLRLIWKRRSRDGGIAYLQMTRLSM